MTSKLQKFGWKYVGIVFHLTRVFSISNSSTYAFLNPFFFTQEMVSSPPFILPGQFQYIARIFGKHDNPLVRDLVLSHERGYFFCYLPNKEFRFERKFDGIESFISKSPGREIEELFDWSIWKASWVLSLLGWTRGTYEFEKLKFKLWKFKIKIFLSRSFI